MKYRFFIEILSTIQLENYEFDFGEINILQECQKLKNFGERRASNREFFINITFLLCFLPIIDLLYEWSIARPQWVNVWRISEQVCMKKNFFLDLRDC